MSLFKIMPSAVPSPRHSRQPALQAAGRGWWRPIPAGLILLAGLLLASADPAWTRDEFILPRDGIFDAAGSLSYPERSRLSGQVHAMEDALGIKVAAAFLGYLPAEHVPAAATDLAGRMLPSDRPALLAVHSQITGEVSWHVREAPWSAFVPPGLWQELQADLRSRLRVEEQETPAGFMLRCLGAMAEALAAVEPGTVDLSTILASDPQSADPAEPPLVMLWAAWGVPVLIGLLLLLIIVVGALAVVARARASARTAAAVPSPAATEPAPRWFPEVMVGERLGAPFGGGAIGLAQSSAGASAGGPPPSRRGGRKRSAVPS